MFFRPPHEPRKHQCAPPPREYAIIRPHAEYIQFCLPPSRTPLETLGRPTDASTLRTSSAIQCARLISTFLLPDPGDSNYDFLTRIEFPLLAASRH